MGNRPGSSNNNDKHKSTKSKAMKKIASWNEEHKSASQLRKQRQREQIEKKLKEKLGSKKSNMEKQYEVGLESQYVSPLSWSKAESTVDRGDTIVVNPNITNQVQCRLDHQCMNGIFVAVPIKNLRLKHHHQY